MSQRNRRDYETYYFNDIRSFAVVGNRYSRADYRGWLARGVGEYNEKRFAPGAKRGPDVSIPYHLPRVL